MLPMLVCCLSSLQLYGTSSIASDRRITPLIADNWQVPGSIQKPGEIQKPGDIQAPKGNWQTPGDFQRPAEIQKAKGPWIKPNWVTVKDSNCEHRLEVGADVLFAFNKWDVNPTAEDKLTLLGKMIKKYGNHPIRVEGHTDGVGTDEYNQNLSEKRASAVKEWMTAHQFMDSSATSVGFGKRKPIAPNKLPDGKDNPAGRTRNRRVDIVIDTCK
jgi:outer membrane protein OmpA-like peptidoglycan-associated protein